MTDIITSLERISDHCSNVAGCVEEIGRGSLGIHAYTIATVAGDAVICIAEFAVHPVALPSSIVETT